MYYAPKIKGEISADLLFFILPIKNTAAAAAAAAMRAINPNDMILR